MKCIVAIDNKWGIGKNNELLFHLRADMKRFAEITTGKVVVMGSNTLLSLPNSEPLKNRTNIVLWPGGKRRDDVIMVESFADLLTEIRKYNRDDVYIIGGAMMYHTMLPYCDTALITRVYANGDAVVFLDNLEINPSWKLAESSEFFFDGDYKIQFCTYTNSNPLAF